MDQLEGDLEAYEGQLSQINMCISTNTDPGEEMISLRDSIKQLIDLTKQQLLEKKRKELLQMLPQDSPSPPPPPPSPPPSAPTNPSPPVNSSGLKNSSNGDEEILIGTKVRAPFMSKVRGRCVTYHNAVISEEFHFDNTVRVVFLNPVELAMVACPFFLEGRCKFSDEKCRYSHGCIVSQNDLRYDYRIPDYSVLKEGQTVLAKNSKSHIWEHATCDIICDDEILVKWNENLSEKLPLASVMPLQDSNVQDDAQIQPEVNQIPANDILEESLVYIDPSASALGDWEQHTRGKKTS